MLKSTCFFFFIVIFSAIIASCNKTVQEKPAPEIRCYLDSQTSTIKYPDVEQRHSHQYFYDKDGQWIAEKFYNNGELMTTREFEYERGGNHRVKICRSTTLRTSEVSVYKIKYNQQGQISGYQAEYPDVGLNNEVIFVRGNDQFTSYTIRNNDTTNKAVYFYKNGNSFKVEYWVRGQLQNVDSLEFDNQIRQPTFHENTQFFSPPFSTNKNHLTRMVRYYVPSGSIMFDDRYRYYLNTDGTVNKYSVKSALSYDSDTAYIYSHYSCR